MKKLLTAIASAIIFASLAAIAPAQPVVGGNQIVTVMANKTTGNLSTPGNLTFTAGQTLAVTGGNISFSAPLTVANGGTGLATTANGFAVGAAANAYQFISASGNRVAGVNALAGNSPVLFTLGGNLSLSGNTISATGGNVYAAGNNTFTANNTFSGNLLGGNASFSTLTINGNTISGTGFTYSSSGGGNLSSFGGNKSFVISGGVNAPNTGNVSIMRNEINSGTMTISQGNRSFSISGGNFTGTPAPLLSPAFTGTPTLATMGPGSNNTTLATTAYADAAVAAGYGVGAVTLAAGGNVVGGSVTFTDIPVTSTDGGSHQVTLTAGDLTVGATHIDGDTGTISVPLSDGAVMVSGGVMTTVSDERLKTIVGPLRYGLSELSKVNPVIFTYKDAKLLGANTHGGFSAQNVRAAGILEAVSVGRDKDGTLGFDERPVVAALVNAVNELNRRLIAAEEEIATVKKGALKP